jgi:hypothetical protein
MRLVQFVCNVEDEEEYRRAVEQHERDKMVRSADWKVYADEVLQKVDEQLAAFGLEVFQYETGGDYYEWHIERRIPRSATEAAAEAAWREERARQEKEAVEVVWGFLGLSQEDWVAESRKEDALEPWREERRRQFAGQKIDPCSEEEGTTGPRGVPLDTRH